MALSNVDPPWPALPILFLLLLLLASHLSTSNASETDILMKFKSSLRNASVLDIWNASTLPCSGDTPNWAHVRCHQDHIWGLQLENMSLAGVIDIEMLTGLTSLRTLSFMNNSFDGRFPEFNKLFGLKALYLSDNKFSGEIPDNGFEGMGWLKKVHLARNQFTGKIPTSLAALPKLLELRLEENQFDGKIPDFRQKDLKIVNVSHNNLEGMVPESLSKMGISAVSGNKGLCGKPLDPCNSPKKPSTLMIAIIVVIVTIIVIILITIIILLRCRPKPARLGESKAKVNNPNKAISGGGDQVERASQTHSSPGKKSDLGKLLFIRDDTVKFDLQDLLRASAEVLGSGTFGSSYKAALLTGPVMVVKRFRQMNNLGREEFQEHMRRLGRLRHSNLLSLVAYYYRREEKLLVSEFVENGSLAYHLHGNRSADKPALNWSTRLKIIKGVAKGLAYLYNELPSLTLPHGHLKSSNVLLNESFEPLLTDYGLVPVITKEHATQLMVAYKSPEYTQYGQITKKTDIWSFGILILEMLTGKFPENYLTQGKGGSNNSNEDLAKWVKSVVSEEWTGEVFDKEMKGTKNGEGEMLKLLKIGLGCCEEDVEKRWELRVVVAKIEELKERENDDDYYSSFASEGEVYSSRAMTEDELSFSMNG